MLILYLTLITLGLSNAIPDLLSNKISLCKPCTGFWLGLAISLVSLPFGSIDILVIPCTSYLFNKLFQNFLI